MAHCFMFFIAGYENTTGVLCATLFELARNTHVQEKLYLDISKGCVDENEDITFKNISEMKYLDMVVNGKCAKDVIIMVPKRKLLKFNLHDINSTLWCTVSVHEVLDQRANSIGF